MEFKQPKVLLKENGEYRKAGFELEFGEVDMETIATCILDLYGGKQERTNKFHQVITDTNIGKFTIKFDSRILTEKTYEPILKKYGLNGNEENVENLVESIASFVVPYEVDTPPLPFQEIYKADLLRKALHEKKAMGTKSSVLYAYATHINPELPALDVDNILRYTRAFLLLYPWVFSKAKIDLTRRMSVYINPFPDDYLRLVFQAGYNPSLDIFIEDYHKYNPDRNRPFDLYPVLSFIKPDKINHLQGIGNVKPRPTFHYRLPNSLIDDPTWSLASEWNCWVAIENLASNPEFMSELCKEYIHMNDNILIGFKNKWIKRTEEWVEC
ncbi:MAG TPA: amidoligase family protein [Cytophagaceae bacterium]|jgi:hypothetical protein